MYIQTWGLYQLETGENGLSVGRFNPAGLFIGGRVMIAGGMSGNAWSKRVDFFDAKRNVRFSVRGRACFGNREKHMGYEGRIRFFFSSTWNVTN